MSVAFVYDHDVFKAELDSFVEERVAPVAAAIDRDGEIPRELIEEMGRRHYLAPFVPAAYGGMGMNMTAIGLINEAFGKGCSSVRGVLTVQGMVTLAILRWGTAKQKNYWLPLLESGRAIGAFGLSEAEAGTDAANLQATSEQSGDGHFIINGRKKWISLGQIADVYLIFAKCGDQISLFLVESDTPGLARQPMPALLGQRGAMLAELELEDCIIPEENLIGSIGTGLSLIGLFCLDYGRFTVAWGCVGIAQSCLEHSVSYAAQRKQFGSSLSEFQLIQRMITEMIVDVKAARLMCLEVARLREEEDPDYLIEAWKAKYFASRMVNEIAGKAVQIHGAAGCVVGHPVERHYRDSKMYEIIEGTSQVHETLIAKHAFQMLF